MKTIIWVGLTVGGIIGGWLGAFLDGNNWFGFWSIALGAVGSFIGIWAAYKIGKSYL